MLPNLVKIAEYKLRQYGDRGVEVSIPKVFATDNNIEFGDVIEIYRGNMNQKDALIIIPKEKQVVEECSTVN